MNASIDLTFFKTFEYVSICSPDSTLSENLGKLKNLLAQPVDLKYFTKEHDWQYVFDYFETKAIYEFLCETFTDGKMFMKDVQAYMHNYMVCWYNKYF
jgi:hypothetical protein